MNSRDRFCETMRYGAPDRVPYFEEGIREDVLRVWRHQGLRHKPEFEVLFRHDRREEIHPDLEPLPRLKKWPSAREELDRMRRRLNPEDLRRLPRKRPSRAPGGVTRREHVVMLHVQRGLFLSMGVEGWGRFTEVIELLVRDPLLVHDTLMIQGNSPPVWPTGCFTISRSTPPFSQSRSPKSAAPLSPRRCTAKSCSPATTRC